MDLQDKVLDLNAAKNGQLNEGLLVHYGALIKHALERLFAPGIFGNTLRVRGERSQIEAFMNALSSEKRYMQSYMKNGLNDPSTFSSKHALDSAVRKFEVSSGLKWPFK